MKFDSYITSSTKIAYTIWRYHMNFDSYITSNTKIAYTVRINTKKSIFDKFYFKKAAFTLAETLITLTIIGVIAALTIPNLISSYQKHTYVVGLKKAYSQLQNAVKMIPITQGCPAGDYDCVGWNEEGHRDENGQWVNDVTNIDGQEFDGQLTKKMTYLLSKQFKINKLCYYGSTDESCEKLLNHFYNNKVSAAFITNDGMIFTSSGVDINGFKGPNKWGRDKFRLEVTNYYYNLVPHGTVIPWGSKLHANSDPNRDTYWRSNPTWCTTENANKGNRYAEYCTGRVLEEDAMNY